MIFQKLKCLPSILVFAAAISLFSCTNGQSTNFDSWVKKAEYHLTKNPDSTLFYTQKILADSTKNTLGDKKELALYQLREKAFILLHIKDSVYVTGQKIRTVASRIPDSLAIASTLAQLYGNVDYKYIKAAKTNIPGAIVTLEKNGKESEKGMALALYGKIMNEEGEFKKSQTYLLQALKIFESKDSIKAMGKIYNELGINFACIGVMNKSNYYYHKALKIAQIKKDTIRQASILLNLGINYKNSNPAIAVKLYRQALDLLPPNKGVKERMKLHYNLANIYLQQSNYDKAAVIFKKILADATQSNYEEGIMMATAALGNVYGSKKQYALSVSYYKRALKIFEDTHQQNVITMLLPQLIDVYKNAGDIKNALQYTDQLLELKSTILTAENTKSILELEKKYQTEKKDLEIKNLEQLTSLRYKIIILLSVSLLIVVFLWRQRNRLYQENKNAYAILMKKYKEENESRNKKSNTVSTPTIDAVPEDLEDVNTVLYQKIVAYYETKKPYLDSKLKAEFIAKELGVSQREVAAVLKANGFSSFTNFNNKFRVEEVKKCFDDIKYDALKTEAIATQCGFGSKQPFYNAFEEFTGLNPGYYRSEIKK